MCCSSGNRFSSLTSRLKILVTCTVIHLTLLYKSKNTATTTTTTTKKVTDATVAVGADKTLFFYDETFGHAERKTYKERAVGAVSEARFGQAALYAPTRRQNEVQQTLHQKPLPILRFSCRFYPVLPNGRKCG